MTGNINSGSQALTPTCTNYVGAEVTISVPGPGIVFVTANAQLHLELVDTVSEAGVFIDTRNGTTEGCPLDAFQVLINFFDPGRSPPPDPTSITIGVFVQKGFGVEAAGTSTYYLNVLKNDPDVTGNDAIIFSSMIAVYYPFQIQPP